MRTNDLCIAMLVTVRHNHYQSLKDLPIIIIIALVQEKIGFYQLKIFWQVEDDAEDDGWYHVPHDSSPGLVGSGHHREVVLHGFGDRQVPLDGQDDRGDHGAHQRDRLKLVEEVDESDHLKKARQWNLRFSSMDLRCGTAQRKRSLFQPNCPGFESWRYPKYHR